MVLLRISESKKKNTAHEFICLIHWLLLLTYNYMYIYICVYIYIYIYIYEGVYEVRINNEKMQLSVINILLSLTKALIIY